MRNSTAVAGGTLPVVEFNGDDGFLLTNDADLYLTDEISIYAVVVPDPGQSQIIIGNYTDVCGSGLGVSDNKAQEIKWFICDADRQPRDGAGRSCRRSAGPPDGDVRWWRQGPLPER